MMLGIQQSAVERGVKVHGNVEKYILHRITHPKRKPGE